jgi:hypothetical protein
MVPKKLHNEELHNLSHSFTKNNLNDQVKEDQMGSSYSRHRKQEKSIEDLLRNPERRRPLGRHRHM